MQLFLENERIKKFLLYSLAIFFLLLAGMLVSVQAYSLVFVLLLTCIVFCWAFSGLKVFVPSGFKRAENITIFVLLISALYSLLNFKFNLPVAYVLELFLFLLVPILLVVDRARLKLNSGIVSFIFLFLTVLCLQLLSSTFGRSHVMAMLWQLMYNLKLPLMFLAGSILIWDEQWKDKFRLAHKACLLISVVFLAIEVASPKLIHIIFGGLQDWRPNELIGSFFNKNRSIFPHSGYLAAFSVYFLFFSVYLYRGKERVVLCVLALMLLLLSGQRQETLAAILALLWVFVVSGKHWKLALAMVILVMPLLVLTIFSVDFSHNELLAQWGMARGTLSERAELTVAANHVANQYFPLGSGLGTYGGPGAQKFDLSLFEDLGFDRFWWFRKGEFLVDTYWPNIYAEAGWIAAAILLLAYTTVFYNLSKKLSATHQSDNGLPLQKIALASFVFLLLNSPTSPLLTDPRGAFLAWLFVGGAMTMRVSHQNKSNVPIHCH